MGHGIDGKAGNMSYERRVGDRLVAVLLCCLLMLVVWGIAKLLGF